MNIKEYIESGILEAYVLDTLTNEERLQVEANIAMYPELKEEVLAIEESLLQLAVATSVEPPVPMQAQIWNALQPEKVADTPPVAPKTIEFLPPQPAKWTWQRAAIWVALVGSVMMNMMLWLQRNRMDEERLALQEQMDTVRQQQQYLATLINDYRREMEMMADTNMQTIVMKSIVPGHPMAATVYWNKDKGAAYLAMKKMPPPPEGMQYQVWVIQDGNPVSMGVLPNEMADNNIMAELPVEVTEGQAFAISLEKAGGSLTPTAENIYVLGKAS